MDQRVINLQPAPSAQAAAAEPTPFLQNAWYVAALSQEVDAVAFFNRRILDISVLIYRKENGEPVALQDRCPHRFVPLHLGKRVGDEVVCQYHALKFDCNGVCTNNPHGDGRIPKAARVRSFPLVERFGFIWIWMGDEPADLAKLSDFGPLSEGPDTAVGYTYMHVKANYELIIDNVMDLSHIDHVHGEIISTRGQLTPLIPQVKEADQTITARWEWQQTPAMLIFANFLPEPAAAARHFFNIVWSQPANIQLSVGANQDGGPMDLASTVSQYDLHTTTPETATTTHYYFATRRNHLLDDAEYNTMKIKAMHAAFEDEDVPLIEAVQNEMATTDFFSLKPVLMTNDTAPVRVRRLLTSLIRQEQDRRDEA